MPLPGPTLFLAGPTASGKSDVAAHLAHRLGGHVVNADPFQAIRGLGTLTAQPCPPYDVPHHAYGCIDPTEGNNAAGFARRLGSVLTGVAAAGATAVVVSGSGLYLDALAGVIDSTLPPADPALRAKLDATPLGDLVRHLEAIDPGSATTIDLQNPRRVVRAIEITLLAGKPASELRKRSRVFPDYPPAYWLDRDPDDLRRRIAQRTTALFDSTLESEIRALGDVPISTTTGATLGLAEAQAWVNGSLSIHEAIETVRARTWQYARRQRTWFRGSPHWTAVPVAPDTPPEATADAIVKAVAGRING